FDFSRDTAAVAERHQHQVATSKTEIRSDPRSLGPNGAFRYLYNYIRPDGINARYVFNRNPFSRPLASAAINFFNAAVKRSRDCTQKVRNAFFLKAIATNLAFKPNSMFLTFPLKTLPTIFRELLRSTLYSSSRPFSSRATRDSSFSTLRMSFLPVFREERPKS